MFLVDIQARSSNVNEVIRAVLNSLFFYYCFFLRKDFARTKSTKSTKTQPSKSTWWSNYTNNSVSIHTNKN